MLLEVAAYILLHIYAWKASVLSMSTANNIL